MSKQLKKEYILNNIEKYIIDSRRNFFHIDPEMLGDDRCYIGRDTFTPGELKEIWDKWFKNVVKEKEDWEVFHYEVEDSVVPRGIKNKRTGHQMFVFPKDSSLNLNNLIGWKNYESLMRELGDSAEKRKEFGNYVRCKLEKEREFNRITDLIWDSEDLTSLEKNYQIAKSSPLYSVSENTFSSNVNNKFKLDGLFNTRKEMFMYCLDSSLKREEVEKQLEEKEKQPNQSNQTSTPSSKNNPSQISNPKKQTNDPNKPNQNNLNNSFLPSSSKIQNQYNSDKDKSIIDNNFNLTNPEQKIQAQEVLKLIIAAELLIKKKQFNQVFLNKLLKEKELKSSFYQLFNKEKRIDKAIEQLQKIKETTNSSKSVGKPEKFPLLTKIGLGGIILVSLILLVWGITKRAKKRKLWKKSHHSR